MINIKHVSGAFFSRRPDAFTTTHPENDEMPVYPGVVCRTGFGAVTLKYRPAVSYRKHRHIHPNGEGETRVGAVATLAGMVC